MIGEKISCQKKRKTLKQKRKRTISAFIPVSTSHLDSKYPVSKWESLRKAEVTHCAEMHLQSLPQSSSEMTVPVVPLGDCSLASEEVIVCIERVTVDLWSGVISALMSLATSWWRHLL